MAGLKAIKTKIRSIQKTKKVTKAMEAVSAAKMRKAQLRAISGRAYARAATHILSRVAGSEQLKSHTLVTTRVISRALYIIITSDKGLAGALNSAVLRATSAHILASGLLKSAITIVAVGRKANDYFTARGYNVETYRPNTDVIDSATIFEIVHASARSFVAHEVDVVHIAYQNFISTFEQRPTLRTIFPLSLQELQKVVGDIVPAKGALSRVQDTAETMPSSYSIEPSEEEVLAGILPRLASIFVYHALLETQASEHSARMVSMKSASDKAGELVDSFTLSFNKARQAAITREVSEITGGMEAMDV